MSQGRASLEQVIEQYEQQRAEAMRIKQEAEIVLPFLRAAVEELESASGEDAESVSRKARRSAPEPRHEETGDEAASRGQRRSSASVFGVSDEDDEAAEDASASEAPTGRKGFGRASIASLIDEAGKKEKAG